LDFARQSVTDHPEVLRAAWKRCEELSQEFAAAGPEWALVADVAQSLAASGLREEAIQWTAALPASEKRAWALIGIARAATPSNFPLNQKEN